MTCHQPPSIFRNRSTHLQLAKHCPVPLALLYGCGTDKVPSDRLIIISRHIMVYFIYFIFCKAQIDGYTNVPRIFGNNNTKTEPHKYKWHIMPFIFVRLNQHFARCYFASADIKSSVIHLANQEERAILYLKTSGTSEWVVLDVSSTHRTFTFFHSLSFTTTWWIKKRRKICRH